MMMSFAEAIEFINPAYNPNVDSFFPQPVLDSTAPITDSSVTSSNEGSLTVATERFSGNKLPKKKTVEVLRCEICNVSCNSISALEKHEMGKKHRKKTGKQNPEALMLDSVKSDGCMEGGEITSVKNIDKDAHPEAALSEMSTATHIICGAQTVPESFGKCSDVVSEIQIPKHRGFSKSDTDNAENKKYVDSVKSDKCMEGSEITSVKNIYRDATPGSALEEMSATAHISCGTQTMPESFGKCSDVVSEIQIPKHQGFSKSVADNTGNKKDVDSVKSDKCMEGSEITNVKNISKDATLVAALEEMSTTTRVSCRTQTMPESFGKCSDVVSEIQIPKHQGFSKTVAENTANKKDVDNDEIMEDERQSTKRKPDNSAALINLYSTIRVCTVCNIFSTSQAQLEKHLAGKTHARKVKYLATLVSSPVTVYPHNESHTWKLTGDTSTQADPASFVPFVCPKLQEPIHSEGGNVISSPNVCTVCSIQCRSQEIFQAHFSGRKHASKVRMLGPCVHTPSTQDQGATERASKRGKIVQLAYCDVCKIQCNNSEILDAHMMGKKHMKQLKKLGK